ncbi:alpha/beta fold hydrolase [Actinoplanes sp. CA-030573]|uniref:alpha/beta fold hydrolase n=1 Tax=Actinoplanes sp. CA-030573 TaxID=3239898 RepID=UPI003D8CDCDC
MTEVRSAARARMVAVDDGVRLRTWTTGTAGDRPAVVLLHGGPGLWDYLGPVAGMLAPVTVVHRFDQRGCGGSETSPEQSLARSVADIEALRGHWGHERWVVIGHSFGATLALAYAVRHPGRTAALGYLSGVGVGDWRGPHRAERARRLTAAQRDRLAALEERSERTAEEEIEFRALHWVTDFADPGRAWQWALQDAGSGHPINWAAHRALMADAGRWSDADVRARAAALDMPCWFLHGDRDTRPAGTVAELAAVVPGARVHLIAGGGHQPWRERPGDVRRLLRGLLAAAR